VEGGVNDGRSPHPIILRGPTRQDKHPSGKYQTGKRKKGGIKKKSKKVSNGGIYWKTGNEALKARVRKGRTFTLQPKHANRLRKRRKGAKGEPNLKEQKKKEKIGTGNSHRHEAPSEDKRRTISDVIRVPPGEVKRREKKTNTPTEKKGKIDFDQEGGTRNVGEGLAPWLEGHRRNCWRFTSREIDRVSRSASVGTIEEMESGSYPGVRRTTHGHRIVGKVQPMAGIA